MTGKEVKFIRENYKTMPVKDISKVIGKPEANIRVFANRANIRKKISVEIKYKLDLVLDMIENLRENPLIDSPLCEVLRVASNNIYLELHKDD